MPKKFTIFSISILILLLTLFLKPIFGLTLNEWRMLGLVFIMVLFWITEIIPLGVTAVIPIVYAPLMGLDSLKNVTSPFGNPIIFLTLGGFSIGIAIERCGLHQRIALSILSKIGVSPKKQLLGFMLTAALISMWITNTATTAMLLPIVLSVISGIPKTNDEFNLNFSKALLIGLAYAASIGGMGTLVGTSNNVLLRGFLESQYSYSISFAAWIIFAVPVMLIMLSCAYFLLIKMFKINQVTNLESNYNSQLEALGAISGEQKMVLAVFFTTAFCWIFKVYINSIFHLKLTDEIIAVVALLILFVLPSMKSKTQPFLDWSHMKSVPWDILLLLGGGFTLAHLFIKTGLTVYIVSHLGFIGHLPLFVIILLVTLVLKFLTELTSNVATTATTLPIFFALALSNHINPLFITIPLAVSASLAFMMPVGTPPNAIVFTSGKLHIADMVKIGFILNIISIIVLSLYAYYVIPMVFK